MDPVPRPVGAETAVSFPYRLPRAELLGQVPSRDPAPIPANDAFDDLAVAPERAAAPPVRAGQ